MAEIITLGAVGFNPAGEFDISKEYNRLDIVLYQGTSYCAKQSIQGVAPTNSEYWDALGISGAEISNYYTKQETNSFLNQKENVSNKTSVLSSLSTDEEYPTAKCVYDLIGDVENALETLDTGSGI